jgi:hypothetical protein
LGETESGYKPCFDNPVRKKTFSRPRRKEEDNIKMHKKYGAMTGLI